MYKRRTEFSCLRSFISLSFCCAIAIAAVVKDSAASALFFFLTDSAKYIPTIAVTNAAIYDKDSIVINKVTPFHEGPTKLPKPVLNRITI